MKTAFDKRQTATILAALRTMQQARAACYGGELPDDIETIRTDGDTLEPLEDDEIDALCEQINLPPTAPVQHLELLDNALGMLTNFEGFDEEEKPEGFDELMHELRTTIEGAEPSAASDDDNRCPHGQFYSGAGACPACGE